VRGAFDSLALPTVFLANPTLFVVSLRVIRTASFPPSAVAAQPPLLVVLGHHAPRGVVTLERPHAKLSAFRAAKPLVQRGHVGLP